jgi:putative hydrolase of the HAD superfamily
LVGAVGFDLGDTLVEYEGVPLNWQHEYPSALAALGTALDARLSDDQLARGVQVLLRYNTRLTARTSEVSDRELFGELLAALGLSSDPSRADFSRAVDAFFSVFRGRARVMPGAIELISSLSAHDVPVGVLTDVPYAMPRRLVLEDLTAAGLGVLLGTTLTSSEVGVRKPDPAGFLALAARLGTPVQELVFVGNEHKDIQGANAAGAVGVLLWREAGLVPEWGQRLTVNSLGELDSVILGM